MRGTDGERIDGSLIRTRTGHSVLARVERRPTPRPRPPRRRRCRPSSHAGYIAVLSQGPGRAEQVRELPSADDALVILRRPIAGG